MNLIQQLALQAVQISYDSCRKWSAPGNFVLHSSVLLRNHMISSNRPACAARQSKGITGTYMPDIIWGNMSPRTRGVWRTHSHHSHANLLPSLSSVTLRLDDFTCYNCNSCGSTKSKECNGTHDHAVPTIHAGWVSQVIPRRIAMVGQRKVIFFSFRHTDNIHICNRAPMPFLPYISSEFPPILSCSTSDI